MTNFIFQIKPCEPKPKYQSKLKTDKDGLPGHKLDTNNKNTKSISEKIQDKPCFIEVITGDPT